MKKSLLSACMLMALWGCETVDSWRSSDDDKMAIKGERLSVYDFEKTLRDGTVAQFGMDGTEGEGNTALTTAKSSRDDAMMLDDPWTNKFWPQAGGYPTHAMKHLAFTNGAPKEMWSSSIGSGSSRRPLNAAPIVADGHVFTMDTDQKVRAFDAKTGDRVWQQSAQKSGEDESVIGGGLAYSGGRIFVASGFNELMALDAKTGRILWRVDTPAPIRAAPAAQIDRVFAVTLSNETIAYNAATGEQLWAHRGLSAQSSLIGGASPALTQDTIFTAYTSGEVYALRTANGMELWNHNLSPLVRVAGQNPVNDILALPVVADNHLYMATYSNSLVAINLRTGQPEWRAPIGAATTPFLSGNRLYVVGTDRTLNAMDRGDGTLIWQVPLPAYEDPEDKDDPIYWQGPLLAGGRLIVLGSNGVGQSYNPVDGSMIEQWDSGDVMLPPALANRALYMIDDDGELTAWQ